MIVLLERLRVAVGGCTYCHRPPEGVEERVYVIKEVPFVERTQLPIEVRLCPSHATELREALEAMLG